MTQVIVASQNPIKVDCTIRAFSKVFKNLNLNIFGKSFPSGVSDQPMTDEETLVGARTRAENAKRNWRYKKNIRTFKGKANRPSEEEMKARKK